MARGCVFFRCCTLVSHLSKQLCIAKEDAMSLAPGTCATQLGSIVHALCVVSESLRSHLWDMASMVVSERAGAGGMLCT